jgi:aminoglycoside/choline kinase family phosphotransferase
MDKRFDELHNWLTQKANSPSFTIQPMQGDASARRYFRVETADMSYVAMDAPPPQENCRPYIQIANALRHIGLHTPEIFEQDVEQGFLLISDFGNKLLLPELTLENADKLYDSALCALAILKTCPEVKGWTLPLFTAEFMHQELTLFKEWFLEKHLNLQLSDKEENELNACFDFICQRAKAQPQVFMHRDYHSANLMLLPGEQIGILDFQDAFIGPVTYDLVSLLRDCYIAWPDSLVTKWVLAYREKINMGTVSADEFLHWFDVMSLQRHMKALLTFSRKFRRDGNPNYLRHIPRTLNYIIAESAKIQECKALHQFISEQVVTVCEA